MYVNKGIEKVPTSSKIWVCVQGLTSKIWNPPIIQYGNKIVISTAKLVETTWLTRYIRPMEIMYGQGSEFIGHEFIKSLLEKEHGITTKPSTSANHNSNAILERIHKVL